jgi:hypothetical protein
MEQGPIRTNRPDVGGGRSPEGRQGSRRRRERRRGPCAVAGGVQDHVAGDIDVVGAAAPDGEERPAIPTRFWGPCSSARAEIGRGYTTARERDGNNDTMTRADVDLCGRAQRAAARIRSGQRDRDVALPLGKTNEEVSRQGRRATTRRQ